MTNISKIKISERKNLKKLFTKDNKRLILNIS